MVNPRNKNSVLIVKQEPENNAKNDTNDSDHNTSKLPSIFDGEYFTVVEQASPEIYVVRCNICAPEMPLLRAATKSNGNLLKHIQVS